MAVIGDTSGNGISFGSQYTFNAGSTRYTNVAKLDASGFVVIYRDTGNNDHPTNVIGSISGNVIIFQESCKC